MWKPRNKWFLFIVFLVLSPFLFLLIERWRGQIGLAHYKKALAAKGEKIAPSELPISFNESDNGTPKIVREAGKLKPGQALPSNGPSRMLLLPSGHAIVGFHEDEWLDMGRTNFWDDLALDWEVNAPVLSNITVALNMPVFNSRLDYSKGANLLIPNLALSKNLVLWFAGGSQLALYHHENQESLERLLPQILLPHILESDQLALSELVRNSMASIARSSTWEALQAEGWSDDDLRQIQTAWESHDFISSAIAGLQGDFIYEDVTYDLMRNSNDQTFQILFQWRNIFGLDDEPNAWEKFLESLPYSDEIVEFQQKQIFCPLWRFTWSHQDQLRSARHIHDLLETIRALKKTQSLAAVRARLEEVKAARAEKNFYDRIRYPWPKMPFSLSQVVTKAARAQTECSLTICAVALHRYALRHGKFPSSPNLLVPEFFPSVPIDYMDGKPVKYFLNHDGSFTLYSVGEDGVDNNGNPLAAEGKDQSTRNIWNRKDAAWPAAATEEEVEKFRASIGTK
ncbi:MAG: hypothetical protein ABJC04_08130 [Verrucomicrobiota bacterium]